MGWKLACVCLVVVIVQTTSAQNSALQILSDKVNAMAGKMNTLATELAIMMANVNGLPASLDKLSAEATPSDSFTTNLTTVIAQYESAASDVKDGALRTGRELALSRKYNDKFLASWKAVDDFNSKNSRQAAELTNLNTILTHASQAFDAASSVSERVLGDRMAGLEKSLEATDKLASAKNCSSGSVNLEMDDGSGSALVIVGEAKDLFNGLAFCSVTGMNGTMFDPIHYKQARELSGYTVDCFVAPDGNLNVQAEDQSSSSKGDSYISSLVVSWTYCSATAKRIQRYTTT